ncbi:hypothetical protein BLA23254_06065 [Burkholderia lata]|uniref:Uncharacterized protein n=1 Tax=Burkholderia lata (strain ATCC 17760 / DSM 23089 / LMG 22485 / NCIMB 9086 / R18194 / 383) TaxID=482957 RepID=A0A6P2QZR1_BURL3|nr:hypothetical protein BLA23254_06065 [Burkholderia lata]
MCSYAGGHQVSGTTYFNVKKPLNKGLGGQSM